MVSIFNSALLLLPLYVYYRIDISCEFALFVLNKDIVIIGVIKSYKRKFVNIIVR